MPDEQSESRELTPADPRQVASEGTLQIEQEEERIDGESTRSLFFQQEHSGPIASAAEYAMYMQADPEAGPWMRSRADKVMENQHQERILEIQHDGQRIQLQREALSIDKMDVRGHYATIFATLGVTSILAIVFMAVAAYLTVHGFPWPGGTLAAADVGASAYLYRPWKRRLQALQARYRDEAQEEEQEE